MPVSTDTNGTKVWQLRNRNQTLTRWAGYLAAVAIFMWCWQRISEATTWFFVWDAPRIAADIGGRAWPPRWSYMDNLWGPQPLRHRFRAAQSTRPRLVYISFSIGSKLKNQSSMRRI